MIKPFNPGVGGVKQCYGLVWLGYWETDAQIEQSVSLYIYIYTHTHIYTHKLFQPFSIHMDLRTCIFYEWS